MRAVAKTDSTVEERPFRAAKAVPNQLALAAVSTICRAGAFFPQPFLRMYADAMDGR